MAEKKIRCSTHMSNLCQEKDGNLHDFELHPRGRGGAAIIYPVISRRAGGLSLGINLFPERKICSYDCPYCEVMPFSNPGASLKAGDVSRAIECFFDEEWPELSKTLELKDISISGNGEPTLSPFLEEALYAARQAIDTKALVKDCATPSGQHSIPSIVLITNSTGFLREDITELLAGFYKRYPFEIWAKLDGGKEELHALLSRSRFPFAEIVRGIVDFSCSVPVTLQTMVIYDNRTGNIYFDCQSYAVTIREILNGGGQLRAIQIYTTARVPVESWVAPVSDERLVIFARQLSSILNKPQRKKATGKEEEALQNQVYSIPILCYGSRGKLDWNHANR
jgi:histidinol dehydrogenase